MKRISAALIVGLLALLPFTAMGDDGGAYEDSRKQYMHVAEEYRGQAEELRGKIGQFDGTRHEILVDLVSIYTDLATTKEMLADAVTKEDRTMEDVLVTLYKALKLEEQMLWDEFESTKS